MTTGEKTISRHAPTYRDWAVRIQRFKGEIGVFPPGYAEKAKIPLQDAKIPVPEELQDKFGARARVKLFEGNGSGLNITIGTGLFFLRRHSLFVETPADGDMDQAPKLTVTVQQRHPVLAGAIGGYPEGLAPHIPAHVVADETEASAYLGLMDAAAEFAAAQGINHPRELYRDLREAYSERQR